MASNGRVGLRSGSPSFLVVGLSLVIVVLLYSYWSVSSRNSMLLRDQSFLQDRLRSITSQKLAAEKKKSSAMAQVASIEKTKRQLEGNVQSSSREKSELNSKVQELELKLEQEKKKTTTLQSQQGKSKTELQKLKGEIDQTSEKLKELTKKADSFVEMYKGVKERLSKKDAELFKMQNDWNICTVQLKKLKEEHHGSTGDVEKKKPEILKENVFKKGIAHLKKQMQHKAGHLASQPTTNTQQGPQKETNVVTQVPKNTTLQTEAPAGKVTLASGNLSGNDTNKASSTKNATTTTTTSTSIGSTNTTTFNLDKPVESKHNMTKPTKNKAEVESDEDNPDDKHIKSHEDTDSDAEDKAEDKAMIQDEDNNDNAPVRGRAQPIGLRYPKREGSDRERRRLR